MNKKLIYRLLPYVAAITTGVLFYFLAGWLSPKFFDLFINISTAFFAIPLLYLFFKTVESYSHRKLNKEIIDYAKMQIDREILSVLNQMQKIVLASKISFSSETVNKLLGLNVGEITKEINKNTYLGFQLYKYWETSEVSLHKILKNPFILEKMEDEQVISIISILKDVRLLEFMLKNEDLYIDTKKKAKGYKIISGVEINPGNKLFPDRYLLMKHIGNNKYVVSDFGDIAKYNLEKCLRYYKVNKKLVNDYSHTISELITDVNHWLKLTGGEFVIDMKMFKMRTFPKK